MMRRFSMGVLVIGSMTLVVLATDLVGQESGAPLVGRRTIDRQADTVAELIRQNRLDEAAAWCQDGLTQSPADSDRHAWWLAKSVEVDMEKACNDGVPDEATVAAVIEPAEKLLQAYPMHRRRLFVSHAIVMAELTAASADVVAAVIRRRSTEATDDALRRMIRFDRNAEALIERAARESVQTRNDLRRGTSPESRGTAEAYRDDVAQLIGRLSVARVAAAVMRTELFEPGGQDFVGSAAKAIAIAEDTLVRIPSDSAARHEAELLLIDALLRGGRLDQAARQFDALRDREGDDQARALAVRLDLRRGRPTEAERKLDRFFGSDPSAAPRSLTMDFSRLRFLLRDPTSGRAAADWIEAIGQRHGAYARRRGEALLLSAWPDHEAGTDAAAEVMAIAARNQLRAGNTRRAAEMLQVAAIQETRPRQALSIATQAAAAFQQAGDAAAAADVLRQISQVHRDAENAAPIDFQAIVMQSRQASPPPARVTADRLKQHLTLWPQSDVATTAKRWAIALLQSDGRDVEAIEVLGWTDPSTWTAEQIRQTGLAIRKAISGVDDRVLVERVTELIRPALSNRFANQAMNRSSAEASMPAELGVIAVSFFDVGDLKQVRSEVRTALSGSPVFFAELLAFRTGEGEASAFSGSPPGEGDGALDRSTISWRLMRDGRMNPGHRRSIAAVLDAWHDGGPVDLAAAERHLWSGRREEAMKAYDDLIAAGENSGRVLRQAAEAIGRFAGTDRPLTVQAIRYWDRLAAGLPKGSASWHEARLAAIDLLTRIGDAAAADKRARYVLLTDPPDDPATRTRYQRCTGVESATGSDDVP